MVEVLFNRKVFFDSVRKSLFGGALSTQQVDGMDFKLQQWEAHPYHPTDLRWLSYPFATSFHETAAKMWPVEEYGKGKGKEYGKPHAITGKTYYGRGDVQLTWYENYVKATRELGLQGTPNDLGKFPEKALDPKVSADVMFMGMREGWFRKSKDGKPHNLLRYFNINKDEPFEAREIINGDKNIIPKWSNGVKIGNLIAGYHGKFLTALNAAFVAPERPPEWMQRKPGEVSFDVTADNANVTIKFNGEVVFTFKTPDDLPEEEVHIRETPAPQLVTIDEAMIAEADPEIEEPK